MAYVQVYTGDGKGKTTAALGLLLRATGAGLSARVFQFLKRGDYSELAALSARFPEVEVTQLGSGRFVFPPIPQDEIDRARAGLAQAREAAASGAYDLLILDEINGALSLGLISIEDVLALIAARHERTELVLTGRGAPDALLAAADLVTEMRCHKHYYEAGIPARTGIEL
ncbi:MAG: cob(I)yrinic acid a,c-diamide adenosyltransferase [Oscillospiraceae bacterium]|jgi:cob(I)alamin adenosyltransferase|nr:cob(I)yrinic acid a,c-diamide adenosyltransferase [Oscillospiraceae bacterium]